MYSPQNFFFEKGILRKFFNFIVFEYIGNIKIQKKMLAAFWTQILLWRKARLEEKSLWLGRIKFKIHTINITNCIGGHLVKCIVKLFRCGPKKEKKAELSYQPHVPINISAFLLVADIGRLWTPNLLEEMDTNWDKKSCRRVVFYPELSVPDTQYSDMFQQIKLVCCVCHFSV